MSTKWASLLLRDIDQDSFREGHFHIETEKELKALEEENRQLSARVAELESRLKQQHRLRFKPNKKRGDALSGDKRNRAPRKRGAPVGHPPWQRAIPDRVDRSVQVPAPTVCPHCQASGLHPTDTTHIQRQEDIVLQPRTLVTDYIHQMAYCPNCRREVFQTAQDELRNCAIGPVAKAAAVYLRHEVKLSYRDVTKVFSGLFGMPFVPASAMAFSHRCARNASPFYEDLRNKIQAAHIAHGDETHWRLDGQNAFLWYAGNPQIAFYHLDPSRSSQVAVSIFGSAFTGNLVSDSYAAYNAVHPKRRQICLSHLIRRADEIAQRILLMPQAKQHRPTLGFCHALGEFFAFCCRLYQRRCNNDLSFSDAKAYIPRLQRTLRSICLRPLPDSDAENLRNRILDPKRDAPYLFTYLSVNGMPPTNNHSEQSLRHAVIFRKISFGSRSLQGAQALATNLSMLTTAKRQNRDPITLFKRILLNGPNAPPSILYDPANIPQTDSS
jgi:transposase